MIMELKDYQQKALNDIERYLDILQDEKNFSEAYKKFWMTNNPPIAQFNIGGGISAYKNNVKNAPHLCVKVPTGGGKTLMAAASLKVIFNAFDESMCRTVVWLVPSNSILEQTIRNLQDKRHPYRQRIDTDFNNRVIVIDKQQALFGQEFSAQTVRENLCILVMSYDSFRARNKEGRKVYQDNGYLNTFQSLVDKSGEEDISLSKVLGKLHPVVIVDESHNATSELSEQMICDLQPSFVLDLTATPRQNSNIISFVDAMQLKNNNMVKLPVIVKNHQKKEQVIDSALHLQRRLEQTANEHPEHYIRPIVLFQAESKNGTEDRETFDKVKKTLVEIGIPEEQIKIKTAEINELKDIDLMSRDCPVRYIITINALKEGWDCPFAYILASLADRSSAVDVEQIVGRVLRLPYTRKNEKAVLNMSYVLTASAKFQETLDNVVRGLNNAGFSDNDCRKVEEAPQQESSQESEDLKLEQELFADVNSQTEEQYSQTETINRSEITFKPDEKDAPVNDEVETLMNDSKQIADDFDRKIQEQENNPVPEALKKDVKTSTIQKIFVQSASEIVIPQFVYKSGGNNLGSGVFGEEKIALRKEHLLKDFKLSEQPASITFNAAPASTYRVDLDPETDEHVPRFFKVDGRQLDYLMQYLHSAKTKDERIKNYSTTIAHNIGKMWPLSEKQIEGFVSRIFENLTDDQIADFDNHFNEYIGLIKKNIEELEEKYQEQNFRKWLNSEKIKAEPMYKLPETITLKQAGSAIPKMLHSNEEAVNGFESEAIIKVASYENVEFWTRNVEKIGFCINGFINHYPDFIVHTKKGKTILLETKGDHLDAEKKIILGKQWEIAAGKDKFRYFMVYKDRTVDGAYTLAKFLEVLKEL